nr:hypothetical protein [Staphylothermus hellenicus]
MLDEKPETVIHGIIAPGHVSAVIGSNGWRSLPRNTRCQQLLQALNL